MLKFINLVLFTIAVIVGITFFTVDKPVEHTDKNASSKTVEKKEIKLSLNYFPNSVEVIGKVKLVKKNQLFSVSSKTLLIVGNHDSMSVIKDLKKHFDIKIPYVMVANISNAPWFIKKWAIPGKLLELTQDVDSPMIFDDEGLVVQSLALYNTEPTKYFVYIVHENGDISNVYTGSVKEGALEYGITDDETKTALSPILEFLN
ncbi:hypothetical protein A9Q76_07165 [Arcobacter sp. 31_11_sub10_T18]|nr:hypothetical protein A9Q76_07165 [Arcobacter sp. 31_11_sub10_T18]